MAHRRHMAWQVKTVKFIYIVLFTDKKSKQRVKAEKCQQRVWLHRNVFNCRFKDPTESATRRCSGKPFHGFVLLHDFELQATWLQRGSIHATPEHHGHSDLRGERAFKTHWPRHSPSHTPKQVCSCKGYHSPCLQSFQPARWVGGGKKPVWGGTQKWGCPRQLWLPHHSLPHPFFQGMQPWSQSAQYQDINHSNSLWGDLLAPGKDMEEKKAAYIPKSAVGMQQVFIFFPPACSYHKGCTMQFIKALHLSLMHTF